MTITSTEFQRRPGHYLQLAEKGQPITIKRNKRSKCSFTLQAVPEHNTAQETFDAWMNAVRTCKIRVPNGDAVAFQRHQRS